MSCTWRRPTGRCVLLRATHYGANAWLGFARENCPTDLEVSSCNARALRGSNVPCSKDHRRRADMTIQRRQPSCGFRRHVRASRLTRVLLDERLADAAPTHAARLSYALGLFSRSPPVCRSDRRLSAGKVLARLSPILPIGAQAERRGCIHFAPTCVLSTRAGTASWRAVRRDRMRASTNSCGGILHVKAETALKCCG